MIDEWLAPVYMVAAYLCLKQKITTVAESCGLAQDHTNEKQRDKATCPGQYRMNWQCRQSYRFSTHSPYTFSQTRNFVDGARRRRSTSISTMVDRPPFSHEKRGSSLVVEVEDARPLSPEAHRTRSRQIHASELVIAFIVMLPRRHPELHESSKTQGRGVGTMIPAAVSAAVARTATTAEATPIAVAVVREVVHLVGPRNPAAVAMFGCATEGPSEAVLALDSTVLHQRQPQPHRRRLTFGTGHNQFYLCTGWPANTLRQCPPGMSDGGVDSAPNEERAGGLCRKGEEGVSVGWKDP